MDQSEKGTGEVLRPSPPPSSNQAAREWTKQPALFSGSLPAWEPEALTPPVSDPFSPGPFMAPSRQNPAGEPVLSGDRNSNDETIERGCRIMTRFMRIAAALSALATIFLVAGAGSKY